MSARDHGNLVVVFRDGKYRVQVRVDDGRIVENRRVFDTVEAAKAFCDECAEDFRKSGVQTETPQ
jgi:hypothetical protein